MRAYFSLFFPTRFSLFSPYQFVFHSLPPPNERTRSALFIVGEVEVWFKTVDNSNGCLLDPIQCQYTGYYTALTVKRYSAAGNFVDVRFSKFSALAPPHRRPPPPALTPAPPNRHRAVPIH